MMLTQKPTPAFRQHPVHRRMPSAPSPMAVQPTRTPGLLTLTRAQQQQHQHQSPKAQPKRKSPSPVKKRQQQQQPTPARQEKASFPVCDDVSEMGDTPRLLPKALPESTPDVPSTPAPSPAKQRRTKNRPAAGIITFPVLDGSDLSAPKTAPLSSSASTPFFTSPQPKKEQREKKSRSQTPSPSKKNTPKKKRNHKRVPSEGVFHMSGGSSAEESDNDRSSSSDELSALLANLQSASTPSTPIRPTPIRASTTPKLVKPRPVSATAIPGTSASAPLPGFAQGKRRSDIIKFAGSGFMSSPAPDELPDPGRL